MRSIEKLGDLSQSAGPATPGGETPTPEQQKAKKEGTPGDNGPTPSGLVNGVQHNERAEDFEQLASKRLAEIETLRKELLELRTENATLRSQAETLPDTRIASSPAYLELRKHAEEVSSELGRAKAEWEALQLENIELREARQAFEQLSKDQANLVVEELRRQLSNKDADILRLRGQRDEIQTENAERKQKEAAKTSAMEEIKALASLKERTAQKLRADVRRLQMVLAGRRGDAEIYSELAAAGHDGSKLTDEQVDIESQLRAKVEGLEATSRELQARCQALETASEHAEVAKQNADLSVRLAELESLTKDAEGQDASARLKAQEELIKRLQSQVDSSDATIAELCAEIDQLGQSKSTAEIESDFARRVIDLHKLEERLVRLSSEVSLQIWYRLLLHTWPCPF